MNACRRSALSLILGLLGGLSATCADQGGGEIVVLVRIGNALPEARALSVSAALDGRPAMNRHEATGNLDLFAVRLQDEPGEGALDIEATALAEDHCKLAVGRMTVQIIKGTRRYEPQLDLTPLPNRTCALTVVPSGEGSVTSDPPGIQCPGRCRLEDLPLRSSVKLSATRSGERSFAMEWGAPCTGRSYEEQGSCAVQMNGATEVRLSFLPRACSPDGWCWQNCDSTTCTPASAGSAARYQAVWGADASTLWAVGTRGVISRCDGRRCTEIPSGTTRDLSALWSGDQQTLWAAGKDGTLLQCSGSACTNVNTGVTKSLTALWGARGGVWAGGESGTLLECMGTSCGSLNTGTMAAINALWVNNDLDVWAAAGGQILKCRSSCAPIYNAALAITDMVATPAGDVWAVGGKGIDGVVIRCVGSTCAQVNAGSAYGFLLKVWAQDASTAWAVGSKGAVVRCDAGSCAVLASGTTGQLVDVWGSDANTAWVVGEGGVILRCSGSTCAAQDAGTRGNLTRLWGSDAKDIWVVGDLGAILRRRL